MKKCFANIVYVFVFNVMLIFSLQAQSWDDGMYHNGRGMMDWRGTISFYSVSGKIIVDTSFTTSFYMRSMRPANYYLDTVGNGSKNYQLFFGPYWYQPKNGTAKPIDGQNVVLSGIKITTMIPPMLSVYIIDGNLWRDTLGVESWSGGWIHKTDSDSTHIFCPTDSLSHIRLSPNSMGSGMMGGGMQWPDSLFCQFEQMMPDSIPTTIMGQSLMGYHLDMFNPFGQTMMQMGSMNNGMMTMMKPVQIVFHISQDSLNNRGLSMNQLTCRYMDNNGNWNTVSGLTINSTANTITISQSNLYSYYVIIPSSATTVETENNLLPKDYNLKQNYPNPFNPSTVIEFSLPQKAGVKLTVFNILGKKVAELVNGNYEAGNYSIRFDAQGLSSGVYFYQLKTDNFYKVKKMQLIR